MPRASGRASLWEFEELLGGGKKEKGKSSSSQGAMGPADYLELMKWYDGFVVMGVKRMGYRERDAARRFITFVDAVYESRVSRHLHLCSLFLFPVTLNNEGWKDDVDVSSRGQISFSQSY